MQTLNFYGLNIRLEVLCKKFACSNIIGGPGSLIDRGLLQRSILKQLFTQSMLKKAVDMSFKIG